MKKLAKKGKKELRKALHLSRQKYPMPMLFIFLSAGSTNTKWKKEKENYLQDYFKNKIR